MDANVFVQNVKKYCAIKGVAPTVACRESGAGKSLMSQVAQGIVPSVSKVQLLAQYLGVTTSNHSYFNLNGHCSGDVRGHTLRCPVTGSFNQLTEESAPLFEGTDLNDERVLGEAQKSSPPSEEDRLLAGYDALSARNREKLEEYLDLLLSSQDRP